MCQTRYYEDGVIPYSSEKMYDFKIRLSAKMSSSPVAVYSFTNNESPGRKTGTVILSIIIWVLNVGLYGL